MKKKIVSILTVGLLTLGLTTSAFAWTTSSYDQFFSSNQQRASLSVKSGYAYCGTYQNYSYAASVTAWAQSNNGQTNYKTGTQNASFTIYGNSYDTWHTMQSGNIYNSFGR